MKIERTKNAGRNILYGGILKVYHIFVPFLMRTALIYLLGVQYLGLNSLFSSVLKVLNLAELGVGSAMVYSMYKPIAEDDTKTVCALMGLYRKYYRIIGIVILVAGLALLPFLPFLVKTDTVPVDIDITILYLINLSATILTYWMFAYKNCLLSAFQRTDIQSKINFGISTIQYVIEFGVLYYFKNYYAYTCVLIFCTIANNLFTAWIVNKKYPDYHPVGKMPANEVKVINQRIRDLFTAKLGAIIVNSVDTVVISAFLGLTVLAEYQNYYFIINAIIGLIAVIFSSITAGIGNSLVVETKDKNYNDLVKLTFIICWISGVCSSCFLNLFQPFMKIWVGDKYILSYSIVICLVIYFYIREVNQLLNTYKDAGGIWHADRFRPLLTGLANMCMNLITVQYWGLYGVVLSTVLSMLLIGMPWLIHNLFTKLFKRDRMGHYLKRALFYITVSIIACIVSWVICNYINFTNTWITLCTHLVLSLFITNVVFIICYRRLNEFKDAVILLNTISHRKFEKILKRVM